MSTQMAKAFNEALAKATTQPAPKVKRRKTLIELAWIYVKDNPGCTAGAVASIYGKSAPQALSSLFQRKMVTRTSEVRLAGDGMRRKIHIYRTAMREYELLPMPAKPSKPKLAKQIPAQIMQTPAQTLEQLTAMVGDATLPYRPMAKVEGPMASLENMPPIRVEPCKGGKPSMDDYIDNLTVGEAREMLAKLKKLFQ